MEIFGGCTVGWLGLVIVVFVALILRRQSEDGILTGVLPNGFNLIGALVLGVVLYAILITFIGGAQWALLGGLVGVCAGGFLVGIIFPSEGGSDYG